MFVYFVGHYGMEYYRSEVTGRLKNEIFFYIKIDVIFCLFSFFFSVWTTAAAHIASTILT